MKRLSTEWAMKKKTNKYIATPRGAHPKQESLPLVVVLRDVLGVVDGAREARKIISEGKVLVDGKVCRDKNRGLGLFDVLHLPVMDKAYRILMGKKMLIEVPSKEATTKLCRVVDKKVLRGGKIQINLHDGRNIILEKNDYLTNDSLLLSLPDQKIVGHVKFEEGCLIFTQKRGVVKISKIQTGMNKRIWMDGDKEIPFKDFIVVGKDKPIMTVSEQI
jgi:small subunit ribosomal protein S4e